MTLSVLPVFFTCYLISFGYNPESRSVSFAKADVIKEAVAQNMRQDSSWYREHDTIGTINHRTAQDRLTIGELERERTLQAEIIKRKDRLKNTIIYLFCGIILFALTSMILIISYIRKRGKTIHHEQMEKIAMLRMQNLRNRMSPHFFFNALALLSTAVEDPKRAGVNLASLSLLLRKSIENIDQMAIPIEEELNMVKAYIDLQLQIIPGSFDFDIEIEEGINMQQWLVLAMMIQIPVENAIKHGLMPLEGERKLAISIAGKAKDLIITIKDNGIGFTASSGRSTGTGTGLNTLLQTISLLNQRNKDKIKFIIGESKSSNGEKEGVVVTISIPDKFSFD